MQRIYMEYCPHGDLMDLLRTHAKCDGFSRRVDDDNEPIPQVRIPVRALWSIFKDLAAAACIMKYGYNPLDTDIRSHDEWEEILHRYLKPDNIFLAAPVVKTGREIPVCKLGDFGIAVPRDFEHLVNPEGMRHAGTDGWKAPEFQRYKEESEFNWELTSAIDVWAIGRILLALMELSSKTPPRVRYDDKNEGHVIVEAQAEIVDTYGQELYGLVQKCLEPHPIKRIKARDLLRMIDQQLSNTPVTQPLELQEGDILEYLQEMRWAT